MNSAEAKQLLEEAVERLRGRSRAQLARLLGNPEVSTVKGPSGQTYQVETEAIWDDREGQDLRVMVLIDDGGWSSLSPMSKSFIIAPDGSFVGK